ncbi:MAG TPA: hypothetical protein VNT53_01945 [Pseudolysinimonas sp.]|nr:hypothetical protein [Pseudolysinimonas sp.]
MTTPSTPDRPEPREPLRDTQARDAMGTPVDPTTPVVATPTPTPVADPAVEDPAMVPNETHNLRHDVIEREKVEFGGMKFGSAFFGWLTATGTAVLLTALVSAAGAAIGLGTTGSADEASDAATRNAETVGLVGAIALIVVLFVAYLAGGYVAGRMARFSGAKQGVAVWLWAVIIAIVVAIIVAIAGSQFDLLANLNSFPRIPLYEGTLTVTGVITAVAVAVVSLVGAVVGGLAGMRYHRKVDRVGLGR